VNIYVLGGAEFEFRKKEKYFLVENVPVDRYQDTDNVQNKEDTARKITQDG
jgi:hypothetical protein